MALLDPAQLQAEAQRLEQQEAWDSLLKLVQQQRPGAITDERFSGYLDYLAGRSLVELRLPQQAEPLLRMAAAALPEVPFVHNLLGRALAELEQWLPAAAAQQRCLSLKPDFAYAWLELGRAREALGDSQGALEAFRAALPLLPDNSWLQQRTQALEITLHLQAGNHSAAAAAICELQQRWTISDRLLCQWLDIAAALLACGTWNKAIAVASAIRIGTEQAGKPSALGSRCPVVIEALALLLASPGSDLSSQGAEQLAGSLQESLWLPNDRNEDEIWKSSLADLFTSATHALALSSLPCREDLCRLLLALAELAAARFKDHQRAFDLLHVALGQPDVTPTLHPLLAERAALAAVAIARDNRQTRFFGQAIQLLRSISPDSLSPRARSVLHEARLGMAGHYLPSDLTNVRLLARMALAASDQRPLAGRQRTDLDQLLWRINSTVVRDTASLAHLTCDIPTAQAMRAEGLNLIADLTASSLNPPGMAPLPRHARRAQRWLFLASGDLPQCFLYRVQQKREQLQSLNCEVRIIDDPEVLTEWSFASELLWAEALIVCRLPGTYPVIRAMGLAQRFGMPVYYDIDDLIFDAENFPPPLASYGGTISADVHTGLALDAPLFKAAMEQADALIFSTHTLERRWRDLHPQSPQSIFVLPNLAPALLRREASSGYERLQIPVQPHEVRLLVSSGTLAHKQVWVDELAPALAEVLTKHPQLHLDLVGSISWPDALAPQVCGRVRSVPFSDYSTYLHHLGRAHIGLAPLEPGIVTDSKSAIKWMEYSTMGLATVVSPTATYREILHEGEHCLFASDRQGWVDALERLIADPQFRARLALQAHHHARKLFGPEVGASFWNQLQTLPSPEANKAIRRDNSRRKILIINCFFAPQSVGGATRVAQDRVRELLAGNESCTAADVTVLCVDLDPWQGDAEQGAIPLDVHQWYGARVIRLGLSPKPWDWHHDGDVEQFCRQWFQRENFDEIEAHSIQILTAAPLRVAQELGIPYRVVLHDAWWLSRLQFLTRQDGTPVDLLDPLSDLGPEADEDEKAAALERRKDLMEILAGAQERLAVSESFADLYHQAGVRRVGVRRNKVQTPLASSHRLSKRPRSSESVRFCMVGGMAVHKGYAVLRAAIQQANLGQSAVFTVVDHRLNADEPSYSLCWGGSPVTFVPAIPMDRMQDFYATQDVLIAPSIWPESFGLVTREALAAGLWVIAADSGALAEPVEDGVNGRKVHPGSVHALASAISECLQRPECLRQAG